MKKTNDPSDMGKVLKAAANSSSPKNKFKLGKSQLLTIFASFALIGGLVGAALFIRSRAAEPLLDCSDPSVYIRFDPGVNSDPNAMENNRLLTGLQQQLSVKEAELAGAQASLDNATPGAEGVADRALYTGIINTLNSEIAQMKANIRSAEDAVAAADTSNKAAAQQLCNAENAAIAARNSATSTKPNDGKSCELGQDPYNNPSPTCWVSCGADPVVAGMTTWTLRDCLNAPTGSGKGAAPAVGVADGCGQSPQLNALACQIWSRKSTTGACAVAEWYNVISCRTLNNNAAAKSACPLSFTNGAITNATTCIVGSTTASPGGPTVGGNPTTTTTTTTTTSNPTTNTTPTTPTNPATPAAKSTLVEWTARTSKYEPPKVGANISPILNARGIGGDTNKQLDSLVQYYLKDAAGKEQLIESSSVVTPGKYMIQAVVTPRGADSAYPQKRTEYFDLEILKITPKREPVTTVSVNSSAYNPNERVLGAVLGNITAVYGSKSSSADPNSTALCDKSTIRYEPDTLLTVGPNVPVNFYCKPTDTTWYNDIADSFTVNVTKANPTITWSSTSLNVTQGATFTAAQLDAKVKDINGVDITGQGLAVYTLDGAQVSAGASVGGIGAKNLVFKWTPSGAAGSNYNAKEASAKVTVAAQNQPVATTPPKTVAPAVTTKPAAKPAATATPATPANPATPAATPATSPVPAATENTIEIKDLWLDSVDKSSAVLVWKTSKPTKSEVQYGTTESYGNIESDAALVTDHKIALKGDALKAGTQYHAKVVATDDKGAVASSPDFTFTTSGYYVTLKLVGKDGKPVPAGVVVKLGDQESTTDSLGNAIFSSVGPGSQEVTYVLGDKTFTADSVSVAESDSPQEISVRTSYGKSASGSGLVVILLLALLVVPLILLLLWFLKRRGGGDDGYGSGDSQDYFATYGQQAGQQLPPTGPAVTTGTDWQQEAVSQVPPTEAPGQNGDSHNFPWAK